MAAWKLVYTRHAQKDAKKLSRSGIKSKAEEIIELSSPSCSAAGLLSTAAGSGEFRSSSRETAKY